MLVNYLWTHMMFIYRPSQCARPPFFSIPRCSNDITFFHMLQMGRVWVRVWWRLIDGWREIGFSFCLFRFWGEVWWRGGLRRCLLAGLGVWFLYVELVCLLSGQFSSTNRQIWAAGDSKLPLGVRVYRALQVGGDPSTRGLSHRHGNGESPFPHSDSHLCRKSSLEY